MEIRKHWLTNKIRHKIYHALTQACVRQKLGNNWGTAVVTIEGFSMNVYAEDTLESVVNRYWQLKLGNIKN